MSKLTTQELQTAINEARHSVPPLSTWRHKKGGLYQVVGYVVDTDDGTILVRYNRIDGPDFDAEAERGIQFARSVLEWTPDRFTFVSRG